jgi:hypothetical protein
MEALIPEISLSHSILPQLRLRAVRTPIDLNDEPLRQAGEIDDEAVDRHLLAKLETNLLQRPQLSPKAAFG